MCVLLTSVIFLKPLLGIDTCPAVRMPENSDEWGFCKISVTGQGKNILSDNTKLVSCFCISSAICYRGIEKKKSGKFVLLLIL